jgi:hypothetical protein
VVATAEQRCGIIEQPERREQAIDGAVGRVTISRDNQQLVVG